MLIVRDRRSLFGWVEWRVPFHTPLRPTIVEPPLPAQPSVFHAPRPALQSLAGLRHGPLQLGFFDERSRVNPFPFPRQEGCMIQPCPEETPGKERVFRRNRVESSQAFGPRSRKNHRHHIRRYETHTSPQSTAFLAHVSSVHPAYSPPSTDYCRISWSRPDDRTRDRFLHCIQQPTTRDLGQHSRIVEPTVWNGPRIPPWYS